MDKIVRLSNLSHVVKKLRSTGKSTVLVGGVFDILHIAHVRFLQKAKTHGDILLVLLESDERVQKVKGVNRPFHSQTERAELIAALACVDYVVLLPYMKSGADYAQLIHKISPSVIALTQGDPHKSNKSMQAQKAHARIVEIPKINTPSTTSIARLLQLEQ